MNLFSILTGECVYDDQTDVPAFHMPVALLHWLSVALWGLVCASPFVAWTVPVRQALTVVGV